MASVHLRNVTVNFPMASTLSSPATRTSSCAGSISASTKARSTSGWRRSSPSPSLVRSSRCRSAPIRPACGRGSTPISTAIEAEILLLDEGLGAGDTSFIEKANERVEKLAAAAGIIVVATHSEVLLRQTCTKAALMEAGRILAIGDVEEMLAAYHASLAA